MLILIVYKNGKLVFLIKEKIDVYTNILSKPFVLFILSYNVNFSRYEQMISAFINVSCKYNLYKSLEEKIKKNYKNFFEVLWNYKKIQILIIIF